jgi:hypothetical protein
LFSPWISKILILFGITFSANVMRIGIRPFGIEIGIFEIGVSSPANRKL